MDDLAQWWHRVAARLTRRLTGASTGPTFRLTELPPDITDVVIRFLTGVDVLRLSHVNRQFYNGVLASDAGIWQRLAPLRSSSSTLLVRGPPFPRQTPSLHFRFNSKTHPLSPGTAKQRYCTCRSIFFQWPPRESLDQSHRGEAIATPCPDEISRAGSFSFNLVFALLSTHSPAHAEGILLGAQSERPCRDTNPDKYTPFVYTDANRNLYCSVTTRQPIIREKLRFDRWYHVTLVFEVSAPGCATQRVYLDGELVDTTEGWLHDDWAVLSHMQLGTGYSTDEPLGRGVHGWHGFDGLVDECRFWNGALQADQVYRLISGQSFETPVTNAVCTWSV